MFATQEMLGTLAQILADAADQHILPSFRNLDPAEVSAKRNPTDLVTAADVAAEAVITKSLHSAFGDVAVVGEEAVAADPRSIDALAEADVCFLVDPIDGTLNFARGLPVFGTIIAIIENAETTGGVIYDPLSGDLISAIKGQGARFHSAKHGPRALRLAAPPPLDQMNGFVPYSLFAPALQPQIFAATSAFNQTSWLGCSAYEYHLLATGGMDFSLGAYLQPWDHAAGCLIHSEAGGHSALITGEPYRPVMTSGTLLSAPDKASWEAIRACFAAVPAHEWPGPQGYAWPP